MKYIGWVATLLISAWLIISLLVWFTGIPNPKSPNIFYYQECHIGQSVMMWPTGIHRTVSAKVDAKFCEGIR